MGNINLTPAIINKLQFVPTIGLRPGKYNFPDFLVIGPQRTGTTWLHRNLNFHPEIQLSPRKELHYFNGLGREPEVVNRNIASQRLERYCDNFSFGPRLFLRKNFWNIAYYRTFSAIDFSAGSSRNIVAQGELTASYAAMDRSRIQEICLLNPEIKAVLMLRNPVERAWSHAKLYARSQNKKIEDFSSEEITTFLTSDYQIHCGSYSRIIKEWEGCLASPENLFVGIYDRLKSDSISMLRELLRFLEVDDACGRINAETASAIINPTVETPVPMAYKDLLYKQFEMEIQVAAERFGVDWFL